MRSFNAPNHIKLFQDIMIVSETRSNLEIYESLLPLDLIIIKKRIPNALVGVLNRTTGGIWRSRSFLCFQKIHGSPLWRKNKILWCFYKSVWKFLIQEARVHGQWFPKSQVNPLSMELVSRCCGARCCDVFVAPLWAPPPQDTPPPVLHRRWNELD